MLANPKKKIGRFKPKGRLVEPTKKKDIEALFKDGEYRRDRLVENLHIINDHYGYLNSGHLAALASLMKISQAEIWEVASFYDHFMLVGDDKTPPPTRTIRVCTSLSCMLAGAETLLQKLKVMQNEQVRIIEAPCIGACDKAPAVADGHELVDNSELAALQKRITAPAQNRLLSEYCDFIAYQQAGGYQLATALQTGKADKTQLLAILNEASLRGLGGAGFPTGRKWQIVAASEGPRLMAVNGDEGEPGTFKDRYFLSTDPHRMIEGILIASHIVGIYKAFIYLRGEYPEIIRMLNSELEKVKKAGLADHLEIEIRRGAGAYICGEESAMIESIEGKRGLPRHRPPYVAERGLFGRPTLVNNVETLYWIRDILEQGAQWYNQKGKPDHPGFRSYSLSGRIKKPGVYQLPAGSTVAELIEAGGGMLDGHDFKAYLPGGASGGILPASMADIPLDFGGKLAEAGCFVGSHAVIILSSADNMWQVAQNLIGFFKHESCGQCTPCRAGTEKALTIMATDNPDTSLLKELAEVMADASICGLGQAAPNPLISVMKYFPEDIPIHQS